MHLPLIVRHLGLQDYVSIEQRMREFTETRDTLSPDEFWFVEHPSVFTQGLAGKSEHLLNPGSIPVVQTQRGGQVTYHGPGQLIVYTLVDLTRRKMSVRELVSHLENAVVATLNDFNIHAYAKKEAPGVYVESKKIASLGLKIRKGRSFHGLALNVKMDLTPFQRINPCGYAGLEMTQCSELGGPQSLTQAAKHLLAHLAKQMQYSDVLTSENKHERTENTYQGGHQAS